jgi:hypothetical protein
LLFLGNERFGFGSIRIERKREKDFSFQADAAAVSVTNRTPDLFPG